MKTISYILFFTVSFFTQSTVFASDLNLSDLIQWEESQTPVQIAAQSEQQIIENINSMAPTAAGQIELSGLIEWEEEFSAVPLSRDGMLKMVNSLDSTAAGAEQSGLSSHIEWE